MDDRGPPEYTLEIFADKACAKAVVKAVLHLILFHRYFTPLTPSCHDLLDLTLPYIANVEVEAEIDERAGALLKQLDSSSFSNPQISYAVDRQPQPIAARGNMVINFLEKKRKKGWFGAMAAEDALWESWNLDVSLAASTRSENESTQVRKLMESSLRKTTMTIINTVNRDRNHIPPIVTNESNPFPHQILVKPRR